VKGVAFGQDHLDDEQSAAGGDGAMAVGEDDAALLLAPVKQRLSKTDTGTLFLLNKDGVTVIRRLRIEEEHQIELDQQRGN
jgi:hypothetical protein